MKKGKQPALYAVSSLASAGLDVGVYYVLHLLLGPTLGVHSEAVCNVAARVVSSFFNFNVNNRLVFENRGPYGKALFRYYCLAVPQLAVSTLLLALAARLVPPDNALESTILKVIIDGTLFVISFFIQKFWVFGNKKSTAAEERQK